MIGSALDHLGLELCDVHRFGEGKPNRAAMIKDEFVPQRLGKVAVSLRHRILAVTPHPANVVHLRKVMAHPLRTSAVALVDTLVEGLICRAGRTDVAKIPVVIDKPVKAARIAGRLDRRERRSFEECGKEVVSRNSHSLDLHPCSNPLPDCHALTALDHACQVLTNRKCPRPTH